jgi:hypothetical protein
VLIAVDSISRVSWPDSNVSVNLTREAVKAAFPYDGAAPPAVRTHGASLLEEPHARAPM